MIKIFMSYKLVVLRNGRVIISARKTTITIASDPMIMKNMVSKLSTLYLA